jgi:hypothetical protein
MVRNLYSSNIYTLIFRAFIILKQEQTCILLELKAHSSIYYNSLLKITDFIIRGPLDSIKSEWPLNPVKSEWFAGVKSSTINHLLHEFQII